MIYIHYNTETGEILNAYHHSCKNIPQPNLTVTDDEWSAAVKSGKKRTIKDGSIVLEDIPPKVEDYDKVMEAHLKAARVARGYTTREPDCYINSTNARWKQDAADWIAFRDAVMEYSLAVMNEYAETGIAPSLADFKAGLPVIEWSAE